MLGTNIRVLAALAPAAIRSVLLVREYCPKCKTNDHNRTDCLAFMCHKCGGIGHTTWECTIKTRAEIRAVRIRRANKDSEFATIGVTIVDANTTSHD